MLASFSSIFSSDAICAVVNHVHRIGRNISQSNHTTMMYLPPEPLGCWLVYDLGPPF
jgi:hypothetical protein